MHRAAWRRLWRGRPWKIGCQHCSLPSLSAPPSPPPLFPLYYPTSLYSVQHTHYTTHYSLSFYGTMWIMNASQWSGREEAQSVSSTARNTPTRKCVCVCVCVSSVHAAPISGTSFSSSLLLLLLLFHFYLFLSFYDCHGLLVPFNAPLYFSSGTTVFLFCTAFSGATGVTPSTTLPQRPPVPQSIAHQAGKHSSSLLQVVWFTSWSSSGHSGGNSSS